MNLYAEEARHGFEHTLGWLRQWACSRSFGLGTWYVAFKHCVVAQSLVECPGDDGRRPAFCAPVILPTLLWKPWLVLRVCKDVLRCFVTMMYWMRHVFDPLPRSLGTRCGL